MKLYNTHEINEFKAIVAQARGQVWMEDDRGSRYDLKNEFDLYRAIGAMVAEDLELFASDYDTQIRFENFIVRQMMNRAA